ncbi:hypothetical protein DLREEDagrD3_15330 [Denitratisoma sp. agr-D3]
MVAFRQQIQDEADLLAPAEGNLHPQADFIADEAFCPVIEQAGQGDVEGDPDNRRGGRRGCRRKLDFTFLFDANPLPEKDF